MKNLRILLVLVLSLQTVLLWSQSYEIDQYNGLTVTTCSGTFFDSGGPIGSHGTSESYSITFCPGTSGTYIELDFTQWNCGNGSSLQVFDGPDNTYNSFGTFTPGGFNPMSMDVSASPTNTSGCLTLQWTSGGVAAPGWTAIVSCIIPCQIVMSTLLASNPPVNVNGFIDICPGDPIQLIGSGVFPQNNLVYGQGNSSSTFIWDFGDGIIDTAANLVNHTYADISGYNVNLTVIDSMGCVSSNVLDVRVRISTEPDFAGTIPEDTVICSGEEVTLFGEVEMTPFELSAELALAGTTFLPDGSGASYSTSLSFNAFAPGQVLTNVNDILGICAVMEHSYLGDLDIWLECPNGSIVDFLIFPNGGGGTYLGVPIDIDINLNPGVGYEYCWSPNPTYGTMSVESGSYATLPAGSYAAEDPWTNFLGCPLNGTWTIGITDNLLSDNGFIFEWGINFNPNILPVNFNYEPSMVSQLWSNTTGVLVQSQDSDVVIAPPAGIYNYTFTIVDDFGCEYDTAVDLLVHPSYSVDFPGDTILCSDASILLDATMGGTNNGALYAWHWDFYGTDTISTDGQFLVTKPGMYSISIPNIVEDCGHTDTINVAYNEMGLDLGLDVSSVCIDNPVVLDATTPPENYAGGVSYQWSTGNTSATITAWQSGTYTVTVSRGDCIEIDEIEVDYDEYINVNLGGEVYLCDGSVIELDPGYPGENFVWSNGSLAHLIEVQIAGIYSVTVSNTCNTSSDQVEVVLYDIPVFDLGPDLFICDGTVTPISAEYPSPGPEPEYLWSTGASQAIILAQNQGIYSATLTNDCGVYMDQLYLTVEQELIINLGNDTSICLGDTLILDPALSASNYLWSTGATSQTLAVSTTNSFELEIENSCGVFSDLIELTVLDYQVDLGVDTSICPGSVYSLNPQLTESEFLWNDGSTLDSVLILQAGTYAVTATSIFSCVASDTIEIGLYNTILNLGNDTTICDGDVFVLSSGMPGFVHEWSNGSVADSLIVASAGNYSLLVHHACGDFSDDISILVNPSPIVNLGPDTLIIDPGTSVSLDAGNPTASFSWSTGETTQVISVGEGTFSVTVLVNGCETVATIVVEFRIGIDEFINSEGYILYPNPAKNSFRVESADEMIESIGIFNSLGQLVSFNKVNAFYVDLDAGKMAEGYYFIRVINHKLESEILRLAIIK
jgi:PKD repeat protein